MHSARELADFQGFLTEIVAGGNANLSPEEALDLWRDRHPDPDEFAADVEAVREALDDMNAGDPGIPLEEYERKFYQQHYPDRGS